MKINLGKFCHALISKTARWRPGTTLVEIVKAVTEHIDNPDADYAVTLGKFLFLNIFAAYFCFFLKRSVKNIWKIVWNSIEELLKWPKNMVCLDIESLNIQIVDSYRYNLFCFYHE